MSNYNSEEIIDLDRKHLWHHMTQHKAFESNAPMVITEGKGLIVKDLNGREFLDACSGGVWCVNVGYGDERMINAINDQMKKMPYYAGVAGNIPAIEFAGKISSLTGLDKVYFSNSGSEANEKAYKMIRQYNRQKYPDIDKYKILYRKRDYHGTTIAALSSTGQEQRKEKYGPFVEGFVEFPHACCYRCDFNKTYPGCDIDCARVVEKIVLEEGPDTVGAVIVEPITAGGGVIPPVKEYYEILQEICKKYDLKLIMDEVVCGFGRTGKMFGYEHYGVKPDIVTMAKGMASSYMPLSGTVVSEEIFNVFKQDGDDPLSYFRDISTYGGSAAACRAGLESTKIVEEDKLVENAAQMGSYLLEKLNEFRDHPNVGDVRGKGLLAGIELVEDKASKTPMDEKKFLGVIGNIGKQGVLVGRTNRSFKNMNNVMNLAPALIVTKEEIDKIVTSIKNGLDSLK
ncbi:taurine-pyruvate aminotransferase [Desulfitispora alkaliphila]|uniref:aminotransferase family protein n=1 Tax=Desulfitispora alkaliphila TaxID=622674 RepID=UPI003D1EDACC